MEINGLKYDEKLLAELAEKHHIMVVIFYGSRAKGDAWENSDWDIALHPAHGVMVKNSAPIQVELEEAFEQEIDFAMVGALSDPLFRWEVYKEGIPLYEDRPERFDDEYWSALKVYEDTAHFRKEEWEFIKEKYR